jgi:hypothetical protein
VTQFCALTLEIWVVKRPDAVDAERLCELLRLRLSSMSPDDNLRAVFLTLFVKSVLLCPHLAPASDGPTSLPLPLLSAYYAEFLWTASTRTAELRICNEPVPDFLCGRLHYPAVRAMLAEAPVNSDWFALHAEAYALAPAYADFGDLVPRIREALSGPPSIALAQAVYHWASRAFDIPACNFADDPPHIEYVRALVFPLLGFCQLLGAAREYAFASVLLNEVIDLTFEFYGLPEIISELALAFLQAFAEVRSSEFCSLLLSRGPCLRSSSPASRTPGSSLSH